LVSIHLVFFLEETEDQLALVRWLTAGLAIPGIRSLHGDAGYLLSNMIAKYSLAASQYRISDGALGYLLGLNVDIRLIHKRSKFYGKGSPLIYEHPVPASVVRARLLTEEASEEAVRNLLRQAGPVTVLLRTEDDMLSSAGLKKSMPAKWEWGENHFARYEQVNIKVSDVVLHLDGKIKR
jgi:hypothetical protein